MIACVLASIMDNVSVFMVSFAGIYTNSIHRKLFPASSEHVLLGVNRYSALAFGLIVLPLAYAFADVPQAMRFMFKTVPLMGIAFFMAVLWRRANRHGALMSFVVALGAMLYSQYQLGWGGDAGLPKTILLYLGLGTLAGYVMSMVTPPEDELRTERFFLLLRTPIGQEQVLRDAGLVEIPGTGTFEDPSMERHVGFPRTAGENLPEASSRHTPTKMGLAPITDDRCLSHFRGSAHGVCGLLSSAVRRSPPSRPAVYGFLWVVLITLALVGLVNLVAWWLGHG
jgi:hypothetical protein